MLHAAWRPLLARAVGAALVIGAVWVALPKFSVREVVVDRVIQRDVPFANHIPQDKPFDNYVPHEVGAAPALAPRSSAERILRGLERMGQRRRPRPNPAAGWQRLCHDDGNGSAKFFPVATRR